MEALSRLVKIKISDVTLEGDLVVPDGATGLVIFAHGSGSSRHSPRNRYVAEHLQRGKLATLLVDLLTHQEESIDEFTGQFRFNIPFLALRLAAIADWARVEPETKELNIGFFGASTGGGAALAAAASKPEMVRAVVSRGGRPDLAADALPYVRAATLLIVGEKDTKVIQLNQLAYEQLKCEKKMIIIPGASHLFEEPGALEQVAQHARSWFLSHLF